VIATKEASMTEVRSPATTLSRRALLGATAGAALLPARRARAQSNVVTIGVLNDRTGPLSGDGGMGSVACVKQAIADLGNLGFTVKVLAADHQNKPDIGAAIARQWYDQEGVDMIIDVPISSISFGIVTLAKEKNKVFITSGSGSTDLTGKACSANSIQWTYDTYMLAKSTGTQVVRVGGDKWFFLTADYVFGHQLERDMSTFVQQAGGKVIGSSSFPYPGTSDFSSYLLQAQASGANVLGILANGADLVSCVKQAHEFGLAPAMRLTAPIVTINDIFEIGPEQGQGIYLTETFYWDMNDRTRGFTGRVRSQMPQHAAPNMLQAGCYSGAVHYLKAVAALGAGKANDGVAVVKQMKAMPCDDDAFGPGSVRIDGRTLFPAYLFQVKTPAETKDPWACYKLIATTPPAEAWPPLGRGCSLVPA
jgi:branched-chain amino acid transport system substrate-binding protein